MVYGLYSCGIGKPTKSQSEVLPLLIASPTSSAIVKCATRSGKTLMYVVAAINRIDMTKNFPQVLCICCTVESALQTGIVFTKIGMYQNVKVGYALQRDGMAIPFDKECHVIVGTPKEIAAFRILGYFNLHRIIVSIFDDGDVITTTKLLNQHILVQLPANCQKIHVSATSNQASLLHFMRDDTITYICSDEIPATVGHYTIKCVNKFQKLFSIVGDILKHREKVIVFCNVRIYTITNYITIFIYIV